MRTRTGYAGGQSTNPNYQNVGFHSEVIEIDYDPSQISYEALVNLFFESHNATSKPYYQRVKSLLFYRNEVEMKSAQKIIEQQKQIAVQKGLLVYTELKPYEVFYLAEPEHQLKALKAEVSLYSELVEMFGDENNLQNSILASKLNGFLYGFGSKSEIESVLSQSGLSEASKSRIWEIYNQR